MRKEILMAVVAGSSLGLLIAFGIWKGNSLLNIRRDNSTSSPHQTATPASTGTTQELKIVLIKPQNLDVATNPQIPVSGLTNPNLHIVISGEETDIIQKASESGNFNENIDLAGGANQIVATVFGDDGSSSDTSLIIVYSGQFQPLDNASTSATAYLGTITDITDSTLQIKDDSGDIKQITSDSKTAFVDTRNDSTKQIKQTDLAIGDYLIALGYKGGNNILGSSRIIVADSIKKTARKAFFGKVSNSDPFKLTLTNPKTNEAITVTPNINIQITGAIRFSGINDGDTIIAVGQIKDTTLDARTIQVLK